MDDSIAVQVLDCLANLVGDLLDALLCQFEVSDLNVVKQVFALHVFQNDVVVVRVFEKVNQAHDVGVLRHLQHIDFTTLLVDLDWLHIFLVDCLDRNFLAGFLVTCQLDQTKLTLAKVVFEVVKVEKVRIAHDLFESFDPLQLLLL